MSGNLSRRKFLKWSLAMAASMSLYGCGDEVLERLGDSGEPVKENGAVKEGLKDEKDSMLKRKLGGTGHEVGLFSLGGQATLEQPGRHEESIQIINRALDLGVNYIDTAPSYGNGISEEYIGEVMKERRQEVFLTTKTHDRSYDGTMRLIEESLERLQTDYLDMYQIHNIRTQDEVDRILAKDGAIQALEKLKDEGVIEFTGITGHKEPSSLLKGIREYDFDCLLMAFNVADIHYNPFQEELLAEAVKKDMGIIAMKIVAHGRVFDPQGVNTMEEAIGYVWSFPISTAIVGISTLEELEENVRLAEEFAPFSEDKLALLESLVKPYQEEANFFKYSW